ncbi:MAG: PIG-L family deacetylase [Candidatus Heimdallarchaeota archaeon]|nr:MAG: PIG-L family deacetylase [Candidatus Heimdallarchaeota archaeon]
MTGRILVLAPHTDDGELSMGGSIAKLIEQKRELYLAAFSCARASINPELPDDTLIKEIKKAADVLGLPQDHLKLYDYPVRRFSYNRQDILEELVKLRKELEPEIIFLPSPNDLHQDHTTLSQEGVRAFKTDSILGYELPWNNITFRTQCFSVLQEKHVQKKIEALLCYKSQSHREYVNPEFVRGLAIARGVQIKEKYAEAFEVIRWKLI